MSKVYSFRLSDDNPREAQAREVIEAWVEKGYPLRYLIVDTLISYKKVKEAGQKELASVIDQLNDLIVAFDCQKIVQKSEASLSNSFMTAMKNSVKEGISSG